MSDVELSVEEKIKIASGFLLSSPPGEVNDVFNDIRGIINNDEALQVGITPVLEEYNTEQLLTVTLPDTDGAVIISKHNRADADHFIDPRSKQIFKFDHLRQIATDAQPHIAESSAEELRAVVDEAVSKYASEHFPEGADSGAGRTGAGHDGDDVQILTILIVSNKYSPQNFWNGRWRSIWTVNLASGEVKGRAHVVVHYYEHGNIQLNSTKEFTVPTDAVGPLVDRSQIKEYARQLVKQISTSEKQYQFALNDTYTQLSESIFKGLRRNLPVTRNKIDWDKILNYKLGAELAHK
ncbi:F-actin capping protein, alpha subunit [Dimargaris cristalligena]|uniref:F-actin-capping protein subunit alpha n=1 Tax=Dimargaris cristalligena TaxID=215637 RepID=A0A4Q0A0I5_9FUNG|nr:F-actin capping protein, alpha subunit [Dimargaris cristalligena]|eukprot:RKP39606.1 F-actin capping protein, alpha subunit [Dimargaris cristalligena]